MNRCTLLLTAEINCVTDHVYCLKVTFIYLKAVVVSSRVLTCSFLPSFEHNLQKNQRFPDILLSTWIKKEHQLITFQTALSIVQFVSSPKKL